MAEASNKTKPKTKTKAKPADAPGRSRGRSSKLRWLLGWILVPGLIIALLFLAGVHVGARHPDMWLSRAALWAFGGEAQRAPTQAQREPLARQLWLVAVPGEQHSLHVTLTLAEIKEYAGLANAKLDEIDCPTLCKQIFAAEQPDDELLEITRCEFRELEKDKTRRKLDCEARLER